MLFILWVSVFLLMHRFKYNENKLYLHDQRIIQH
jgi:hypothetical protein